MKKGIKHNKHINNQNEEAFIVIVINCTFSIFFLCLLFKIIFFFKKNNDPENENQIIFLFCRSIDPIVMFPIDKTNLLGLI